jgi:hypothetical protein
MYHLATVLPAVRRFRVPLSRDQVMLLMVAINGVLLGVEHYMAHLISGTIRPEEWIPIIFGPTIGVLVLLAGMTPLRRRRFAPVFITAVLSLSIAVGLLGAYFHLIRAILPTAPVGQRISLVRVIWSPPLLGPLTASLVGLLGIMAIWPEKEPDGGVLVGPGGRSLPLPYSKTRIYFLLIGLAALATLVSSVLDHARGGFVNPWVWVPTAAGVFGTVVGVLLGSIEQPTRADLTIYTGAMLLMMLVGVVGVALHIDFDLTVRGVVVIERFLRRAPVIAPLLFADIGSMGLIVLLDPAGPTGAEGHQRKGLSTFEG